MNEMTATQYKIIAEIYRAVEALGGSAVLLSIIGSWGDTMDDEEVLELLEDYNNE